MNRIRALALLLSIVAVLSISACSAAPALNKSTASSPPSYLGVAPQAPPAAPTSAPAAGARGPAVTDGSGNSVPAASSERMIVYNVQVSLEVQDTDKAVNDISSIVSKYSGYVAGQNLSRDSKDRMRGTVTVRIPAASLDAAEKEIEAAGLKVLSRTKTSNDVTDQYTDLNARLTNLQATESELRQLLDTTREKTGKAEDILAIYNQLTQIRSQIEQIKGRMNVLDKTSAFATVTIQLTPREEVQVVDPEAWLPNQTAREALRTLVQALQTIADLAIWVFLFFAPLLIVLLIPFVILALILRALLRRRSPKRPVPAT